MNMLRLNWKFLLASSALCVFIACGDEGIADIIPVNIDFATGGLSVNENASAQSIAVEFGTNMPVSTSFKVSLSGSATYGTDYTTSPSGTGGSFSVDVTSGTSSSTFSFVPVDNALEDGDRTVILTISEVGSGINIGSAASMTITIADDDTQGAQTNDISVLASKFYHTDAVSVTFDATWVTLTSTNLPDHTSMYWNENNSLYENYDEPNNPDFKKNPNRITAQTYVFKIPRYPSEASNKESTPMGPMGISINSVAFFNQEAAPGDDILEELNTFDQYEGHPAQAGDYHYHIEPVWLTENKGSDAFLGFLLDGFPVYGPVENGATLTNDDLDDYHGHISVTADFPNGIYHYHITADLPWINGDGFYGEAGTVTK
jgi:hypothetical protein